MANGFRPADVFLILHAGRKKHTLKLDRTRVVADALVMAEIAQGVGAGHVRVISGGIPRRPSEGGGNGHGFAKRFPPRPVEVEV